MLCNEKKSHCSEIYTKHITALSGQNVGLVEFKTDEFDIVGTVYHLAILHM